MVSDRPGGISGGCEAGALDAAVASAREVLGIDAREPARAWSIGRIRAGTRGYVLVVFGAAGHASAIAAVDPDSGKVLEAARMPGRSGHSLLTAGEAIVRADIGADADARLVWEPSTGSRSRFYPMWEIRSADYKAWVDGVRGVVWRTLESARGGGGGRG